MKMILLFLSMSLCLNVFADDEKLQPCMEIKKACENGLRGKSGKGQVKDCMKKLTTGESVSGVTVSSSVISACKEKHEK